MPAHIDGNVLAGALSEVFSIDVTTASARCAWCGDISPIAAAMVYPKPHSYIVRCCKCDDVLMVVLQKSTGTEIDLRGLAWIGTGVPPL